MGYSGERARRRAAGQRLPLGPLTGAVAEEGGHSPDHGPEPGSDGGPDHDSGPDDSDEELLDSDTKPLLGSGGGGRDGPMR